MAERPILFSGAMVRTILEGQKTQTRRVVRPEIATAMALGHIESDWEACPYARQPGDRLWVRETWRTAKSLDDLSPANMAKKALDAGWKEPWAPVRYEADGHEENWDSGVWKAWGKTRVSIHMPRWASRLALEVTEARVQRLQEISEEDARAEGVEKCGGFAGAHGWMNYGNDGPSQDTARASFCTLWQSINGERQGCSWAANPWVWCISFRRAG